MTTIPSPFATPATIKPSQMRGTRRTPAEANGADGWPGGNWRDTVITFGDVTIRVVIVTPEMAQQWVNNTVKRNRSKVKARSAMYSRDMKNDAWDFNADPIRLDVNGDMIDGQHRADAVIESGKPQPFLLVEGLLPEQQETMDAGRSRSVVDALMINEESNAGLLASISRRLVLFGRNIPVTGGGTQLSKREHLRFVDENPLVRRAAEVAREAVVARVPAPPSAIGAAYFLCAEADQDAAEQFFVTHLIKAMGVDAEYHPARTLMRRFRTEEKANGSRIETEDAFRFLLQGWIAWRQGKEVRRFVVPSTGWSPYSEIKIK